MITWYNNQIGKEHDKYFAYIEPHKLKINDITYLFFSECNDVFILAHILKWRCYNGYSREV